MPAGTAGVRGSPSGGAGGGRGAAGSGAGPSGSLRPGPAGGGWVSPSRLPVLTSQSGIASAGVNAGRQVGLRCLS